MNVRDMARAARQAGYILAGLSGDTRNLALGRIKALLNSEKENVFAANVADLARARAAGAPAPLVKRLIFDDAKLAEVTAGLDSLIALPDPLGRTLTATELSPGLELYRVSCPIGVIGIVFESRPDALVQIASLCLKSGNAALLKGGSEAIDTNRALYDIICRATDGLLPRGWAALLETRGDVNDMLERDDCIDLMIPRGSNAFVRYIIDHTRIPVMGHADGLCHAYVDRSADMQLAVKVVVDAKTQYPAVCNAIETLLVHRDIAAEFLPVCRAALVEKGVRLRGDDETRRIIDCESATDEDWTTEYLDLVLSVKIVDSPDAAIAHINRFGSHHTDAVIAEDADVQRRFLTGVGSAGVYVNCSTRFADGFRYGFGAEVGVSTGKLHARGPVGLEGLCTYKYMLLGAGQTVGETVKGEIKYTHKKIDHGCPF